MTEDNVPDIVLINVWNQMVKEGRDMAFFYSGAVVNYEQFEQFVRKPDNYVVFIIDSRSKEFVMMAVLNAAHHEIANGHFCPLGPYKRGVGEAVINFWKTLPLRVVWGTTPVTHGRAVKLVQLLGFTTIGVIPGICYNAKENAWVGGHISYLELKEA